VARGGFGSIQTSGSAHTTYQGSSTGPSSISATSDHPIAAPTDAVGSPSAARRATSRTRATNVTTNTAATAKRPSQPSVPKLSQPKIFRTRTDGASQPSCPASSSMPSVGSSACRYGTEKASPIPTATAMCVSAPRRRLPTGARTAHHTIASTSGNRAGAFTDAPIASSATAAWVRVRTRSRKPPATATAISRSLCPLATEWKSTTGFRPNAATANAARDGRILVTVRPITATVARHASPASHRYAATCPAGSSNARAMPYETVVNAGPYTAGVSTHFGPTSAQRSSPGNSTGVLTYGFSP